MDIVIAQILHIAASLGWQHQWPYTLLVSDKSVPRGQFQDPHADDVMVAIATIWVSQRHGRCRAATVPVIPQAAASHHISRLMIRS
jgi:hypothetical protein